MINLIYGQTIELNDRMSRRTTYTKDFTVYTSETYETAYDLTDAAVYCQVKKKDDGATYLNLLPEIVVENAGTVSIDIYIPESLRSGEYHWDMLLVTSAGVHTYLFRGFIEVEATYSEINDGGLSEIPPAIVQVQGPRGPQGIQGPQGEQGPAGVNGADGTSVVIQGSVDDSSDLTSVSSPSIGDGYIAEDTGSLWIYTGPDPNDNISKWSDVGTIVGPPGPQGIQGIQGIQGETGPQGLQGIQGEQGVGMPSGGTIYQVPEKLSSTDYDLGFYSPASVQARFDDGYTRGKAHFPRGEYAISSPIVLKKKKGYVVSGDGFGSSVNPAHTDNGSRSNLYRTYTGSDPLITLKGAGSSWKNLSISGNTWNDSVSGRPSALIFFDWELGVRMGAHHLENINFYGADAAIQCGIDVDEPNCDTSTFTHINFEDIGKGLYVRNDNGMGYLCNHFHWSDSPSSTSSVFYFEGGGSLTAVRTEIVSKATLLTLDSFGSGITAQRGGFYFYGAKVDSTAIGTCLVRVIENANSIAHDLDTQVVFRDCDFSGANQVFDPYDWAVILGSGLSVTFDSCSFAHGVVHEDGKGIFRWWGSPGRKGRLILKNCFFRGGVTSWDSMINEEDSSGDLRVIIKECYTPTDEQEDGEAINTIYTGSGLLIDLPCQDNAASTVVRARVGINGTASANTSSRDTTGPGGLYPSALDLQSTNSESITLNTPYSFSGNTEWSISGWWKANSGTPILVGNLSTSNSIYFTTSTNLRVLKGFSASNFTVSDPSTGWHHYLITHTSGNVIRVFVDGVESSTGSISAGNQAFAPILIGRSAAGGYHNGPVAGLKVYNTDQSDNAATLFAEGSA